MDKYISIRHRPGSKVIDREYEVFAKRKKDWQPIRTGTVDSLVRNTDSIITWNPKKEEE